MSKLLQFAYFSTVNTWSPHLILSSKSIFTDNYPIVSFKEFTKKATIERVKIEDDKLYKILGVRSYGLGVYLNREVLGSTLTMRTYQKAKLNHLFWCKVDTKNGAFGIIVDEFQDGLGSSNMNFAELDLSKIEPKYLQLFFKSRRFNVYMDNQVVGSTNRKYIKFDDLLNDIKIPLPTIWQQKKLVDKYHEKLNLAKKQEIEASQKESDIEKYLFSELNFEVKNSDNENNLLQFVKFKNISRWDTQSNYFNPDNLKSNYKFARISELIKYSQYGLSEKADLNSTTIPFLRMNNIQNGELNVEDLKYINLSAKQKENYLLDYGDILFNRTNSKELVGKCAVFKLEQIYSFASYLIRLKLNHELVNYDYFVILLNSSLGRMQIDATSRQITGQVNINVEELKSFLLPLPSIEIQEKIVKNIEIIKKDIKDLREKALYNKQFALNDFESEIFNETE